MIVNAFEYAKIENAPDKFNISFIIAWRLWLRTWESDNLYVVFLEKRTIYTKLIFLSINGYT